jgi:hypothetical protein
MATVTAFIRTQKTDKNKSANVRFRLRDGRDFQLFHKSELSVLPEKWDEKQQKIKARCIINELERKTFDTNVNDRKALIKSIYLTNGKALTSDLLESEIDKALRPEMYETKPEITTIFQFFDKFIKEAHHRKDKNTGRPLTYRNTQQYMSTHKRLIEFAESVRKTDFEFTEIDQSFYDRLVAFLQKKSYTQNSVGKHIKVLNSAK